MKSAQNAWENMTQDAGTGGLVWATLRNCPCDDDGKVEDETERSDGEDDRRDGNAYLPKIAGEGATEEQQRNLQHQW